MYTVTLEKLDITQTTTFQHVSTQLDLCRQPVSCKQMKEKL